MNYPEIPTILNDWRHKTPEGEPTFFTKDHPYIKSWRFDSPHEVIMAYGLAVLAEKYGTTRNDFQNLFPATLRIFNIKSRWA